MVLGKARLQGVDRLSVCASQRRLRPLSPASWWWRRPSPPSASGSPSSTARPRGRPVVYRQLDRQCGNGRLEHRQQLELRSAQLQYRRVHRRQRDGRHPQRLVLRQRVDRLVRQHAHRRHWRQRDNRCQLVRVGGFENDGTFIAGPSGTTGNATHPQRPDHQHRGTHTGRIDHHRQRDRHDHHQPGRLDPGDRSHRVDRWQLVVRARGWPPSSPTTT